MILRDRFYRRRQTRTQADLGRWLDIAGIGWSLVLISAGVALLVLNMFTTKPKHMTLIDLIYMMIWPLVVGSAIALSGRQLAEALRSRRLSKMTERLPRQFMLLGHNDEGEQVLSVTRFNGEALTINMPEDYDPTCDGGEAVMRKLLPEMFEEEE